MKHFLVEATYCAPIEQVREAYPRHRSWLKKGYDLGLFLCSGPKIPPTGGYLVARAKSADVLKSMFDEEPLNVEKLGDFRFHGIQPGQAPALDRGLVRRMKFRAEIIPSGNAAGVEIPAQVMSALGPQSPAACRDHDQRP